MNTQRDEICYVSMSQLGLQHQLIKEFNWRFENEKFIAQLY